MIEFKYNVEWLDWFLKKLGQLTFENNLDQSVKKAVLTVERQSKINTPVDTWLLRNSYQTSFMWLQWEIRNYREYAMYVHEWTKYQKSQPFMRNAIEWAGIDKIFENNLIELLQFLSDE